MVKNKKRKVSSCHFHWSRHLFGRDEHPSTKKNPPHERIKSRSFFSISLLRGEWRGGGWGNWAGKVERSAFHETERFLEWNNATRTREIVITFYSLILLLAYPSPV